MITTLTKLKERLSITDASKDALLTQFIIAVGGLFDLETGRKLQRTVGFTEEFSGDRIHVSLACTPVEEITLFEYRTGIVTDWLEHPVADPLLRNACVLSLPYPIGDRNGQVRITYTGGYVFAPSVPGPGQTALPAILEAAAVEQVALWFQLEATTGVIQVEGPTGTYLQLGDPVWVPWVKQVLGKHRRLLTG